MTDGGPSSTRSVNEEYLRSLSGTLSSLGAVAETSLFPATRPESLVATLREEHFPADVEVVTLEVRAYTNGDFHVTYAERYVGARRQCRWDRHDQTHNARDHYHPLPDASTGAAEDRSYRATVDDVLRKTVLPWVDDRIGTLWDDV